MILNIKEIKKDVFINKYKHLNIIEDYQKILRIMKDPKLYLVEFEKDKSMKIKNY